MRLFQSLLLDAPIPSRKFLKRLMLCLCGNDKEEYKRVRDNHSINVNLEVSVCRSRQGEECELQYVRVNIVPKSEWTHEEERIMLEVMVEVDRERSIFPLQKMKGVLAIVRQRPQLWTAICEENVSGSLNPKILPSFLDRLASPSGCSFL